MSAKDFGSMSILVEQSLHKATLKTRKHTFQLMMEEECFDKLHDNIIIMKGAKPNETEIQTAKKLAKTDEYYLVFPNDGQIKEIRSLTRNVSNKRNDIYLIDKKTFKAIAVDIKTCGNPSIETIISHLSEGVNQAPNLILDITGKVSKLKLIKGLRGGWSKRLKFLYLNYHGHWHLLDKAKVFDNNQLNKLL
jgi:hypothetical protein